MNRIVMLLLLSVIIKGINAQGIYNDGARIVSTSGNYWVIDNGDFTLTSESASQLTQMANVIIAGDASLALTNATCLTVSGNITVNSGGNITLNSGSASTASLIVSGTASGAFNAKRYMSGSAWHMVSSPVTGASIAGFLSANTNVPTKNVEGTDYRGMMDYNTNTNTWNSFFINATSGNLNAGKGFSVRTDANGTVVFSGTSLSTSEVTASVSDAGEGWNCVGNPFPSAICMNNNADEVNNFVGLNISNLDPSYASVYVWEQGSNAYTIISQSDAAYYASVGQAFFIKAKSGTSAVDFPTGLQIHQPTTVLKSAQTAWPELTLTATLNGSVTSTRIKFNNEMSTGLDVGYDAGAFKTGFDIYTQLVKNNGVDFGLQCLPIIGMESNSIQVGLDASTGGEVSFSLKQENFPTDRIPVLLDKLKGSHFVFSSGKDVYTTSIDAGTKGYGRFELQFSSATGLNELLENEPRVKAWYSMGSIIIEGELTGKTTVSVFDVLGRKLATRKEAGLKRISLSVPEALNGIYLVNIIDEKQVKNLKVVKAR